MAKRSGSSLDGSLPATKRTSLHDDLAACPPLSLTRLAQAGQRNYDEELQFDVVSTDKPSRLLVVGSKTFHWHPPAGFLSRTRVIVHYYSSRLTIVHALLCVTTRRAVVRLRHCRTCVSRYFADSVCMGQYGVRYSLRIMYS